MNTAGTVSSLMFFTLGAVVLILAIVAIVFFRKRRNRHPMEGIRERNYDEIRRGDPPKREP